jgi:hypothetical protein
MAVTKTMSNHFKYQLGTGNIDFSSDVFKMILLDTTFTFDKDSHATLADVTASQLSTGYGYTQDDKTLANVALAENDTDDKFTASWDSVTFTASGGSIGAFGAAIIYDDTTSDDTIVCCIDLGVDKTIADGESYQFTDPTVYIA